MSVMKVLVTDANVGSSVNAIRSLGKRGIPVVAADVSKIAGGFWSKYCFEKFIYPDPIYKEKFIKSIFHAKKLFNFEMIFSFSDRVLMSLVDYKKELEKKGIFLPIPDKEIFLSMLDKFKTYQLAEKQGVPYPDTYLPESIDDLVAFSKEIGFPIVVKARALSGGRGIFYAQDIKELREAYKILNKILESPPLIQKYIPGEANVYTVAKIFDRSNRCVASSTLRKIRESPVTGGAATFAVTANHPGLEALSSRLLERINWIGPISIEYKIDPRDGTPMLMEVNPRFFGYSKLAIFAGVDLPYILYRVVKSEQLNSSSAQFSLIKELYFSRLLHDFYTFFTNIGIHNVKNLNQFIKSYINSIGRKVITFDYLSMNDPLPFFSSTICMVGRELGLIRGFHEVIKKNW